MKKILYLALLIPLSVAGQFNPIDLSIGYCSNNVINKSNITDFSYTMSAAQDHFDNANLFFDVTGGYQISKRMAINSGISASSFNYIFIDRIGLPEYFFLIVENEVKNYQLEIPVLLSYNLFPDLKSEILLYGGFTSGINFFMSNDTKTLNFNLFYLGDLTFDDPNNSFTKNNPYFKFKAGLQYRFMQNKLQNFGISVFYLQSLSTINHIKSNIENISYQSYNNQIYIPDIDYSNEFLFRNNSLQIGINYFIQK